MGALTFVTCFGYSLRASYLRLTGQRENPRDCEWYGVPYVEPKFSF